MGGAAVSAPASTFTVVIVFFHEIPTLPAWSCTSSHICRPPTLNILLHLSTSGSWVILRMHGHWRKLFDAPGGMFNAFWTGEVILNETISSQMEPFLT